MCVLLHGGAIALTNKALEACDAIVDLWVPGQQAGLALADILFGAYSPAGRAPFTFYHATSDLPDFSEYDQYPSATSNGITYRHYVGAPVDFEFGFVQRSVHTLATICAHMHVFMHITHIANRFPLRFGLSYTTFSYSHLNLPKAVKACDDVTLSVMVSNTGTVESDEVVQVYASVPDATVPAPRIRLVAFKRVKAVPPGKSVKVSSCACTERV